VRAGPFLASALLLLALGAPRAGGAARAHQGGTLSVGLVGLSAPVADSPEDTPESASARSLLALPLCRLLPGPVPLLVRLVRVGTRGSEEVQLGPLPQARFVDKSPLRPQDVAASWQRLAREASPYLALLAPVAGLASALEAATRQEGGALRLPLAYPWPDLEASLCHPALAPARPVPGGAALGVGLYAPGPSGRLLASPTAPGGPPFPAALAFSTLPARAAGRALQRGEVQAVLGEASGKIEGGPLLFATYLVYRPEALPPGARTALEAVDVEALVRTFVPGPAVALHALLPPGLLPEEASRPPAPRPPRAPAGVPARPFTLGYEREVPEQRAVAERLQVLLHDAGYPVRLQADSRAALGQARRAGTLEAALVSLLLPPLPAPALALVLGLAGDTGLLARELPGLGAEADAAARAARVAQRQAALAEALPVLPLYARGLRVGLSEALLDARRDGFGLLLLDEAWLRP